MEKHRGSVHGGMAVDLRCKWCGFEADGVDSIEAHAKEGHPELAEQQHGCGQCEFASYHKPTLRVAIQ